MAYATKYEIKMTSPGGVGTYIQIQKADYVGAITELDLNRKGFQIDYKFSDWFKPIINQSCSLSIYNSGSFYDLDDLMTLEEREFKIIVDSSVYGVEKRLFDGWINSNVVSTKYLDKNTIKLTASNYVEKLSNIYPSINETISKEAIINVIGNTLSYTGKDASIRISCSLEPSIGPITANKSLYNTCGIDTEIFWKNNLEREDGTKVLETLLTSFDSYLYYWDEKWYITRYADAWINDGSMHYVEYQSVDASYGFSDSATSLYLYEPSMNISPDCADGSISLLGGTQSISMIPGLQTLEIRAEQKEYLNLLNNDFSNAVAESYLTPSYPPYRTWTKPTGTITPAAGLYSFWVNGYQEIANAGYLGLTNTGTWYNDYAYGDNEDLRGAGWATRFKITVSDSSAAPTTLKIDWKYIDNGKRFLNEYYEYYHIYWYLRNPIGNYYIMYDENTLEWYRASGNQASSAQYVRADNAEFNRDTGLYECSVTIPLTDVSGGLTAGWGDNEFVFSMNYTTAYFNSPTTTETVWLTKNFVGDPVISISGPKDYNSMVGTLNNNVLNKKKVELDIFDIGSLNYRNGIFSTAGYDERTDYWTDSDALAWRNIKEWILHDRYLLYSRNRRKISANFKYIGFIKPMSMWFDSYDPDKRNYLMMDYTYYPEFDEYKGDWWEYDNTETINLNYE